MKLDLNFLQETFQGHADPKTAAGQKAYMKNHFEFLGIKTPVRRQLQKPFLKKEFVADPARRKEVIDTLWSVQEREFQYFAQELIFTVKKKLEKEEIILIEKMVTQKSWWDTVDFIATKLAAQYFINYPEAIIPKIYQWLESDNIWLIRTAILFQLHYKEKTDIELLACIIESQYGSKEFFINKAIGWMLRQYSRTNPDWVRSFIESHDLQPLSRREGGRLLN